MPKTPRPLPELVKDVAHVSDLYAEQYSIERDRGWYLAKLTEELGELAAADLKCTGQARCGNRSGEDLRQDLEREAADLFAHLLLFCKNRNIDLEQALNDKWMKYLPEYDTCDE
ncbi:pyrophosphatase [Roseibium denhamense]|uniref:NTP pyrophosphatase, house-cleaning of non-canonical NTPs n=1 Tax=Roseibium denhamense TaxID=76305 RepID=A0ABY1N5N6_9HYPH|nr:MazG nucleotide pyrophosphohydrolase domain-containing protein [Roseibium denhamense]MTI04374.1 pyrophosphatase [Roseibium denhamense]SMP00804.1 NTP pyrophosphatase, house-cleaning of non-canonical NTPs [Roseibium denhamense]